MIQKYWLLLLIIVSKSHLSKFFFVISNIFIYTRKKIKTFYSIYFFDYIVLNFIVSCFSSPFTLTKLYFILSYLYFSFKIIINSSWRISRSFYACDIKVSMLLNLLPASIRIWSGFFFLFLVIFSNFSMIPVDREKIKVKLALAATCTCNSFSFIISRTSYYNSFSW